MCHRILIGEIVGRILGALETKEDALEISSDNSIYCVREQPWIVTTLARYFNATDRVHRHI